MIKATRGRVRRAVAALIGSGVIVGGMPLVAAPIVATAAAAPASPIQIPDGPGIESTPGESAEGSFSGDLEDAAGVPFDQVEEAVAEAVADQIAAIPDVQSGVYSELEHLGDGQFELSVADEPTHRPEVDGSLTPLDPSLEVAADGESVEAAETFVPVEFGVDGEILAFDLNGSRITMTAPELTIGAPSTTEQVVSFGEVAPGAELRFTVGDATVQEHIVLADASAPRSFRFVISDPDRVLGEVVEDAEGSWNFTGVGQHEQPLLSFPPALAYEADADTLMPREGTAMEPFERSATLSVTPIEGGFEVVQAIDEEWLEGREYPIVLDPTSTWMWGRPGTGLHGQSAVVDGYTAINNTCSVATQGTCVPFTDNGILYAGATGVFRKLRTFVAWNYGLFESHGATAMSAPAPFQVPQRARVDAATLSLRWAGCMNNVSPAEGAVCGPSPTQNVDAHRVTADLGVAGATPSWDQLNGVTATFSQSTRDGVQDRAWHPSDWVGAPSYFYDQEDWQRFNIKDIAQAWSNNPELGAGLVLRSRDEARTDTNGTRWYSTVYGEMKVHPHLSVTFEELAPNEPQGLAFPDDTNPDEDITEVPGPDFTVNWGESNQGSWAIWYYPVLIDADTLLVAQPVVTFDLGQEELDGNLTDDDSQVEFEDVAPGRYYVAMAASNRGGGSGFEVSGVVTVGPPAGSSDDAGFEPWWTFETTDVGPQAQAAVNVGNGNLVVQHTDSTPIQGHGRVGYVQRRTYNSNDYQGAGLLSAGLARGWTMNVTSAGDLGAGLATGLDVVSDLASAARLPVTLVDRDGTHHTFNPRDTTLDIDVGSGGASDFELNDTLGSLLETVLPSSGAGTGIVTSLATQLVELVGDDVPLLDNVTASLPGLRVCIDTTYNAPPGVDVALWRFIGIQVGTECAVAAAAGFNLNNAVVLGYATMRPDRVRQIFAFTGQLLSEFDPAGNELRYAYDFHGPVDLTLGRLRHVWEPPTCQDEALPPSATNVCRELRIDYPVDLDPSGNVVVTDPAGRRTTYHLDGGRRLLEVWTQTADGTEVERWRYTYQGVNASPDCGGRYGQLCSVTAPNDAARPGTATTTFGYTDGQVTTVAERRDAGTPGEPSQADLTTTYVYGSGTATAVRAGHARRYVDIDDAHRVRFIQTGDPTALGTGTWLTQTEFQWDGVERLDENDEPETVLCQADGQLDNRLCRRIEYAGDPITTGAPGGYVEPTDRTTEWTYLPEGHVLTETVDPLGEALQTVHEYSGGHFFRQELTLDVVSYDTDLTSDVGGAHQPRKSDIVFSVIDLVGTTSPAGRHTYLDVDADYEQAVGADGTPCGTGNTGLVCQEHAVADPPPASSPPPLTIYTTLHTYDQFGQRLTTQAPDGGATTYLYFDHAARDLSGASGTPADGWLHAVIDAQDEIVVFGYDRAGNVVRTWDRNATRHLQASTTPAMSIQQLLNTLPCMTCTTEAARYTETQQAPRSPRPAITGDPLTANATRAFANPWRFVTASRDQLGRMTTLDVDWHGNPTVRKTPSGRLARWTWTARDEQSTESRLLANEAPAANNTTTRHYDGHGNAVTTIDPRNNRTTVGFDAANRADESSFTRGLIADHPEINLTTEDQCETSTGAPGMLPDRIMCWTNVAYDGLSRPISVTDPADATTWTQYDSAGRTTVTYTPHTTDVWRRSENVFDNDGNVTIACRPRQVTEGPCDGAAHYATHTSFDGLNRPIESAQYRQTVDADGEIDYGWTELETHIEYDLTSTIEGSSLVKTTDPNGTVTILTIDDLGRETARQVPRLPGENVLTHQEFDPSGNLISRATDLNGGAVTDRTVYSYTAAHELHDTVEAATSLNARFEDNQYVATQGTAPTNTRTRRLYDADGLLTTIYEPRAFTGATSVTDPDERYMTRVDYDGRGRPIAEWTPYYDTGVSDKTILVSGALEAGECPLTSTHQPIGSPQYPSTTGRCVTRGTYDSDDNLVTVTNATAVVAAARYSSYAYTDDNLVRTIEAPNPTASGSARILTTAYRYDPVGRPTQVATTPGWLVQTTWSADGLPIAELTGTAVKAVGQPAVPVPLDDMDQYQELSTRRLFVYAHDEQRTAVRTDLTPTDFEDDQYEVATAEYYADTRTYAERLPLIDRPTPQVDYQPSTTYGYDLNGNPTQVWSPNANDADTSNPVRRPTVNTFTFDNLLRDTNEPVLQTGSQDQRRWTGYAYDAAGRKTRESTVTATGEQHLTPGAPNDGNTRGYSWSLGGLLSTEQGRSTGTITHSYDAAGHPTSLVDSTSATTITATYFLNDWLRTSGSTGQAPVRYTGFRYHADGLEVSRLFDDVATIASPEAFQGYSYNDARALTGAMTVGWGNDWLTWTYTNDEAGRPVTRTGPSGTSGNRAVTWDYRADGAVLNTTVRATSAPTSAVFDSWEYRYDEQDRLDSRQRLGTQAPMAQREQFDYDPAGRLVAWGPQSNPTQHTYGYDANGNRTAADGNTWTYQADNSIASVNSGTSFEYWGFGGTKKDACATYAYDAFDRLSTVTPSGGGAGCPTGTTTHRYDGQGRAISSVTTGTGADSRTFAYIGLSGDLLYDRGNGTTPAAWYVTTPRGPLAATNGNVAGSIMHSLYDDGRSNTTLATASSTGTAACRTDYDPWGNRQSSASLNCSPSTTHNTVWYRGGRLDNATGNYTLGARTYSPTNATWLTPDTAASMAPAADLSVGTDPLTANRYRYVNGDPINFVDPSGHYPCSTRRFAPDGDCGVGEFADWSIGEGDGSVDPPDGEAALTTVRELTEAMAGAGLSTDTIEAVTRGFDDVNVRIAQVNVEGETFFVLSDGRSSALFSTRFSGTFVVVQATPTDLTLFARGFGDAVGRLGNAAEIASIGAAFADGFLGARGEGADLETQIYAGLQEAAPVAIGVLIDYGLFRAGTRTCAATGAGAIVSGLCGAGLVVAAHATVGALNAPQAPPSYCSTGAFDEDEADAMGFEHAPERHAAC